MNRQSLHIFAKREAYLLILASMFMGLFVSLTFQGLLENTANSTLLDRLVIILGELAILLPPIIILKQRRVDLIQVLPLKAVSTITIIMAVVFVIGVIGLVSVFEVIMVPFFPVPEFLSQLELELSKGTFLEILILLIAGSLVAPVVEEFLFRGILQQSLFYRYGSLLPAMVVPTVIFALFHVAYLFYFPAFLELITLALMLAWLMAKTGNLIIPIMVHGLFNLSSFSALFGSDIEEISTLSELGLPWIIISIILTIVGWLYFKNMSISMLDEVYLIPPLQDKEQ